MSIFVMLSCLLLAALVVNYWERVYFLTLLCVVFSCVVVTFPYGVTGQVWNLFVSSPDLCLPL